MLEILAEFVSAYRKVIKLMRVYNARGMVLFYLLGRAVAGRLSFDMDAVLVPLIFILVYAAASILNFAVDRKVDKENKRDNPYSKYLNNYSVFNSFLILSLLSLIVSIFSLNPISVLIATIFLLFFAFIYSHPAIKLSYNPIGKFVLMLVSYTLIPGILGISYGRWDWDNFLFIFAISLIYCSYMIYSDVKDIKGDRKHAKYTLAVVLGVRKLPYFGLFISLLATTVLLFLLNKGKLVNFPVIALASTMTLGHLVLLHKPEAVLVKSYRQSAGYILLGILILIIYLYHGVGGL